MKKKNHFAFARQRARMEENGKGNEMKCRNLTQFPEWGLLGWLCGFFILLDPTLQGGCDVWLRWLPRLCNLLLTWLPSP